MKFSEILEDMKEGGAYRLPHWYEHVSITILNNDFCSYMWLGDKSFSFGFQLKNDEILSDKWIKVSTIKKNTKMDEIKSDLREDLADLEHQQWVHWTKYMIKKLEEDAGEEGLPLGCVPVIFHWKKQCETVYKNLSEKEKDSDREWADKVIALINPKKQ